MSPRRTDPGGGAADPAAGRDQPGGGGVDAHGRGDAELLAAALDGDDDAFAGLVARLGPRVHAVCLRYFGDPTLAEEAVQDTFVTLHRRGASFTGAARLSTWLHRVAVNACHDLARARGRRPTELPLDPGRTGEAVPDVADVVADAELDPDLAAALAALDGDQRDAVVLRDVVGLSYEEVAARCGVPVGTAKSRVHRAHAHLAAHLRASSGEPTAGRRRHSTRPDATTS